MRLLFFALSFIGAAALACSNPSSCGNASEMSEMACGMGNGCGHGCAGTSMVETIDYALSELKLQDNSDIKLAIKLYKKEMRSLKPQIPTDAFEGGTFNPEAYAKSATPAKALQAQIDLFDTIYLVLNEEQKKEFPTLIGVYQHHMSFLQVPKMCGMTPKACNTSPAMCAPHKMGNCGNKSCPMPMKKMPMKKMLTTQKR